MSSFSFFFRLTVWFSLLLIQILGYNEKFGLNLVQLKCCRALKRLPQETKLKASTVLGLLIYSAKVEDMLLHIPFTLTTSYTLSWSSSYYFYFSMVNACVVRLTLGTPAQILGEHQNEIQSWPWSWTVVLFLDLEEYDQFKLR